MESELAAQEEFGCRNAVIDLNRRESYNLATLQESIMSPDSHRLHTFALSFIILNKNSLCIDVVSSNQKVKAIVH